MAVEAARVGCDQTSDDGRDGDSDGDRVLVIGATGAVGRAVCRIVRLIPGVAWLVTATRRGGGDGRTDIDINVLTDPNLEGVKSLLGGRSPDVVIDAVGSAKLMTAAMQILAPRGLYCVLAGF
jgi:NADPH:quinone reductase-like Zn-dependent oxidoreductase